MGAATTEVFTSDPHTGQSSQLSLDLNNRSAEFLPAVARSALNLPLTFGVAWIARKRLRVQRVTPEWTIFATCF